MERDTAKKIFSLRLKELRSKAGLKGRELAEITGIDHDNLKKYESGANIPKFDTMIKLADFFGVSVDYLLGREEVYAFEAERYAEKNNGAFVLRTPESVYVTQKNDMGDLSDVSKLTDLEIMLIRKLRHLSGEDRNDVIDYISKKKDK